MYLINKVFHAFKKNVNCQLCNIISGKRNNYRIIFQRYTHSFNLYNTESNDPAPIFFNPDVQKLLKFLTRVDLHKVYKKRKLEEKYLQIPEYKFMTEEQLQNAMREMAIKANTRLQMPPVVKVRNSIEKILSKNPALQGYDTFKYVFTDITYGVRNSDRIIIVREPNGNLIEADWNTRHCMNQIYFPIEGRKMSTPLMFDEQYLNNLLERYEYEFILDRACIQFEPNDPLYQKIVSVTYDHIKNNIKFDLLRSTRHFGPMVFYFAWFKCIDNLLLELISTEKYDEMLGLIQLYNKIHLTETPIVSDEVSQISIIQKYIDASPKRAQLESAFQEYKQKKKKQKEVELGIQLAHGKM